VVDVTEHCNDPVETVMKVQLGGGTDIGNALHYAAGLVENPRRTIVILITDFYEGAPVDRLLSTAKRLLESGVTLLGLAALDDRAEPNYDRALAARTVGRTPPRQRILAFPSVRPRRARHIWFTR
jgi:Mg-chelatase subunit ChlD